jgi:alkyl hydroperoxide reductase subunit AhpC
MAVSVDPLESHQRWIKDINETQACAVNFPIIADADRKVATAYDMIHPNADSTATVRSVFIIGPDKKIKLTITYPASTVATEICASSTRQLTAKTSCDSGRLKKVRLHRGAAVR